MRKILGIRFGGLQKKIIFLVLLLLTLTVGIFGTFTVIQNNSLTKIVGETRTEQQRAISELSEETMFKIVESSLVKNTVLQASIADNDFTEVVNNVYMLQTMAQSLFENKDVTAARVSLPDPSKEGASSAMVLCEEGVDYRNSRYLGIAANMTDPMIAMHSNSSKIDSLYIGLEDGTDLCVDDNPANKLDDNGRLISFPVRERPWYTGAVEADGIYFTGILADAFSGKLVVTCSAPVKANGKLIGVVGIDIFLESMDDFIKSNDNGFSYVINDKGQIILATEGEGIFKAEESEDAEDLRNSDNKELAAFINKALKEQTDLELISIDGKQYYMAGAPMPTIGWAVISVIDKEITEMPEKMLLEEYDKINEEASSRFRASTGKVQLTGIIMILAIFIAGALAATYVARKIINPIEEMTNDIAVSSQTGAPFKMKEAYKTDDEIQVLAESFDDLSQKIRQYIKDITLVTRENERIGTELTVANKIQSSMIPHIFPPFPDRNEFEVYALMNPAREVGGDFYDFFLVDDDHLCMVIADVSGKGVPAALFMMASKIVLQSYAMLGISPSEILRRTNETLCSNNQVEMFVTVWLGILEISTGKLTAANAGHEYPAVKTPDGAFELIRSRHGFVIGGLEGIQYKEYELQLEPGSMIFLYTDGVPEATDNEKKMYGLERMLEALNKEAGTSPEKTIANVRTAVNDFVKDAEQFDDLTMLCMKYKGKE